MENSKVSSAFLSDFSFQADQIIEMQGEMEINLLIERNQDFVRKSLKLFQGALKLKTNKKPHQPLLFSWIVLSKICAKSNV